MINALLLSFAAAAAPAPSSGWLAWEGCWRALGEENSSSLLCIVAEGNGARLITVVNGAAQEEMRVISDGIARPFSQEGCQGTQQAQWSADGQRLFVNSDMICGQTVRRAVSGIMTMQSRTGWTNVEAVTAGTQTSTRVIRYIAVETSEIPESIAAPLRANRLARETARYSATAQIDLADVKEAASRTSEAAVTTWLTAMNQPFDLTGKELIGLADEGVSPAVIDVLVAVSNPQYFAVAAADRDDDRYDRRTRRARAGNSCYDPFYDPYFGSMSYGYGYHDCYRYGGGHFAPYGNRWDYGYGRPPIIVIRNPANPNAKVTRQGYRKNGSSDSATPSSSTTSSGKTSTSGSKDSSSSGKTSTGRTAKPRDDK